MTGGAGILHEELYSKAFAMCGHMLSNALNPRIRTRASLGARVSAKPDTASTLT
jgi:hypothetical protein